MQIVYDLYENGRIHATYQSRGKAEAACARMGHAGSVKKRVVKQGHSPRWEKQPPQRMPTFGDGLALASAAATLFGKR